MLLKKSFTLLELMVAIGILVIIVTGLLLAYTSCILLNVSNKNLALAVNYAQSQLEEISGMPYADIDSYTVLIDGLPDGKLKVDSGLSAQAKEVTVTAGWDERGRSREFKLFTIFHENADK